MSDENGDIVEHGGQNDSQKRFSRKKLIFFVIVPLLLVFGGGGALYTSGMLDSLLKKKADTEQTATTDTAHEDGDVALDNTGPGHYYDLSDIIVNLSDSGSKQRFLKLSISLEIPKLEDEAKLQAVMPRISDQFQTYLRELRVDDLRGSSGVYRLRQELLSRVRVAARPVVVRDVLFREILVQ